LLNGLETGDRPEVGMISYKNGWCTATLVSPYAVLTAGHCFDGKTLPTLGDYGWFSPGQGSWIGFSHTVDIVRSFGAGPGGFSLFGIGGGSSDNDLALAHLSTAVVASEAQPARVGRADPARGETVTMFGYGCNRAGKDDIKRKYSFPWGGGDRQLCGGDGGGPTLRDDGSIVRVNSATKSALFGLIKDDEFAQVTRHSAELLELIENWGSPFEQSFQGIVSRWSFFERSGDQIGTTAGSYTAGRLIGAVGFGAGYDGGGGLTLSGGMVELDRPLVNQRTNFSFSGFVRWSGSAGVLYSEGEPRQTFGLSLADDGTITVRLWNLRSHVWSQVSSAPGALSANQWSHVAVTLSGGSLGIFVGGASVGSGPVDVEWSPYTFVAALGENVGATRGGGEASAPFQGEIDDVTIYDHALASDELATLAGLVKAVDPCRTDPLCGRGCPAETPCNACKPGTEPCTASNPNARFCRSIGGRPFEWVSLASVDAVCREPGDVCFQAITCGGATYTCRSP
jgi:hypothetical protein